jgi:hypothetical protein
MNEEKKMLKCNDGRNWTGDMTRPLTPIERLLFPLSQEEMRSLAVTLSERFPWLAVGGLRELFAYQDIGHVFDDLVTSYRGACS